ncbi:General transcription and DNA repair factor IIH helicase subunit xpb1, partial [Pleodorina starrii]
MSESQGGSQYSSQGSKGPGLKLKLKLGSGAVARTEAPAGPSQDAPGSQSQGSVPPAGSAPPPPVNKIRLKLAKSMAAAAAAAAAASGSAPSATQAAPAPSPAASSQPASIPHIPESLPTQAAPYPSPPPTHKVSPPGDSGQRAAGAAAAAAAAPVPRVTPGLGFGAGRLKRVRPVDQPSADPDGLLEDLEDQEQPAQQLASQGRGAGAPGAAQQRPGAGQRPGGLEDDDDDEDEGLRRGRKRKAARLVDDEDEEEQEARPQFAGRGGSTGAAGARAQPPAAAAAATQRPAPGRTVAPAAPAAAAAAAPAATGGTGAYGGVPANGSRARAVAAATAAGAAARPPAGRPQAAAAAAKPPAGAKAAAAGVGRGGRSRKPSKQFGAEYDSDELPDDALDEEDAEDFKLAPEEDDDDDYLDDDDFLDDEDRPRGAAAKKRRGGFGGGRGGGRGGGGGSGSRAMRERALGGDPDGVPYDTDFSYLSLKPDHGNRPLWVTPDNRIFLETFSPIYKQAYDFLIAISEPVCRPEAMHEYQLTPHSLYAAVSVGLETETIINVLNRLSKVQLSEETKSFIRDSTANYGKVKLVLKHNHFYVESGHPEVLKRLLRDKVIQEAAVGGGIIQSSRALREHAAANITTAVEIVDEPGGGGGGGGKAGAGAGAGKDAAGGGKGGKGDGGAAGEAAAEEEDDGVGAYGKAFKDISAEETEQEVLEFEVKEDKVEEVKKRCMPEGLNYPMLEEYDFRNDRRNPDLPFELKPHVKLRPYQEKSLSKMFGNGRARSGIIVLPCGAGKSLVGVAAASRVKKSCLCLCTSSVSVDQWKYQFQLWTSIGDHQIARFTSENKEMFPGEVGVLVTTFTMIAFSGKRSEESERIMSLIRGREWGLLLMDEVHVVPAAMFRTVISTCKSHCKLGLTATLVREDERIADLNFLIGPKLYEANWLDLTRAGHIANVQCAEVWCPMTAEFYREYLKKENSPRKQLLYVMNPNKFMACQFLIDFHERVRGDKIIVFSDNIWALREYATRMRKPFIYGPTSHAERTRVLHAFKHNPDINTVFLSKVGDNSLDIPEANVLIQISSHAGSRRQEAQRLGRILRAKRGKAGSGHEEEFNAFFYTLVSNDTQEMYYSTKRQQFLIDQGYSFKVVTNLLDAAAGAEGLMYSDRASQLDLLSRVLSAGMEEAGVETLRDEDAEGLAAAAGGRP